MKIVALMGKSKSGKDTAGRVIMSELPRAAVSLAFADRLKRLCMELYGLSRDDLYTEEGKARDSRFRAWRCPACASMDCFRELAGREHRVVCRGCTAVGPEESFKAFWKNREILQHIGTDGCRAIDDDVWSNFVMREAEQALRVGVGDTHDDVFVPRIVVITDCRFRSEADTVWRAGGEVWRIRRPATDRAVTGLAGHASESEMDTIPDTMFQQVISNDHTLETFEGRVRDALAAFLARS